MKAIAVLILMLTCCASFAKAEEAIHEDWVAKDRAFINKLKERYANSPLSVLSLLQAEKHRKTTLGYGYEYVEGSMGKGYVSTFFEVIYKNGVAVSFKLKAYFPDDSRLKDQYMKLYEGLYQIIDGEVKPLIFNESAMSQPLETCETSYSVTPEIAHFMTPYSGIQYGSRGGEAYTLLTNRAEYIALKPSLNDDAYRYLLCSKNPSTRLTAIEHFYAQKLDKNDATLKKQIAEIFKQTPTITTLVGCLELQVNSKKLVRELSTGNIGYAQIYADRQ